jgi:NAD(P) transhydrogenase subunit alpha
MILGVARETFPDEKRVALIPASIASLAKAGFEVRIEAGAGQSAGYPDPEYADKGAKLVASRDEVFAADLVLQVHLGGANPERGGDDLGRISGKTLIGMCDPLGAPAAAREVAARGATLFALELLPRITRAQSMDVLSSMAMVSGYRAVLLASTALPKMFPMMMTAAGTLSPARVFVVGAGVAGLQAVATARRLGAVVTAYDVRPVVKEQVESLGAKFLEMEELSAGESEDKGGYAKAMDEAFYARQRELMAQAVAASDVVITTAAVPGKKAPILVTADMVAGMRTGSVIVDLAAERGGNCELTRPGERVDRAGVVILGPVNLPSEVPYHASQMYSKNISTFVLHLAKDGKLNVDLDDEIIRETLITREGKVVHPRVCELLGIEPPPAEAPAPAVPEDPPGDDEYPVSKG